MSWLWEKSSTWRWIVASGRASSGFMVAFAGMCVVIPWVVGQGVMSATNYNNEQLQTELLKRGRDRDSMVMGKVNKERLAQLLGEIQRKENTEDRYKAALNGETLTGTPEARIRGGGGTSLHSVQRQQGPPQESKGPDVVTSQMVVPGAQFTGNGSRPSVKLGYKMLSLRCFYCHAVQAENSKSVGSSFTFTEMSERFMVGGRRNIIVAQTGQGNRGNSYCISIVAFL